MRICSPQVEGIPSNSDQGTQVYDRETLRGLAQMGAIVDVILPKGETAANGMKNWRIHQTAERMSSNWTASNAACSNWIKHVHGATAFDVLRVNSPERTGPAALWARLRHRLPVPIVAHYHHQELGRFRSFVERQVIKRCDYLIVPSLNAKMRLMDHFNVEPEKIRLAHLGVDDAFHPSAPSSELIDRWDLRGKKVILTLGGLRAAKNTQRLLDIFAMVRAAMGRDVVLVIAGQGEELAGLRERADGLGVGGQVRFIGYLNQTEKVALYNLADVYATTSRREEFGLAILEAMACGKPVVSTKAGMVAELVDHDQCGWVAPSNDMHRFENYLVMLLTNASLAERFGLAARMRIKNHFKWDRCAREVMGVYKEALDDYRARTKARHQH